MSRIKEIRELLGLTQTELAECLGCTQGNVGHYERGQVLMPDRAERLIEFAASKGIKLTLDQIYGRSALSPSKAAPRTPTNNPGQRAGDKPQAADRRKAARA